MIHRFCQHKFKVDDYKLPSLPQNGRTTLTSTKLCKQLYNCKVEHDFDASTPREYTKPPLMEYSSLHDPHLRSYFYRPEMAIKLFVNGFIDKDLKTKVPLKVYNTYRKYMENETMKIHRVKAEEEEEKELEKQRTAAKIKATARPSTVQRVCRERHEKRRQFLIEKEEQTKARQVYLQEKLKEDIMKQERMAEDRKLERERLAARRESEREQLIELKQQKSLEDKEKASKLIAEQQEMLERRLQQVQTTRRKQMRRKTILENRRLKRYEEHTDLVNKEEEERQDRELEIKIERIKQRLSLFTTLQQREEEKRQSLSQYNRRHSEHIKKEADQFEQHWRQEHENKIRECHEKLERQKQFLARRNSCGLSFSANPAMRHTKYSPRVSFYQEHSPLEPREEKLPKINPERRRSSAFTHINSSMLSKITANQNETIKEEEEQESSGKKVHFGETECIDQLSEDSQQQ